ncbi:Acid protease [Mycena venus]|uniref:Acid protease n=1 Tax=Mycena venus TaxID=2733690 RepID=A0A8H6YI70_9AGAR|nr:Acid protease [Mycena venus]
MDAGIMGMWATNVTVNDQNFTVLIDMAQGGDLWWSYEVVLPSEFSLENATSTTNTTTGGTDDDRLGFATVQLGAIMNMTDSIRTSFHEIGVYGMISLGFLDLNHSGIAIQLAANGMDPTLGQPFHHNVFDQTPDQDNFMSLLILRTEDLEDSASASFMLNELHEAYADAVKSAPHIPRFLVDAMSVNGENMIFPKSSVPGTPDGKFVAGMEMSLKAGYDAVPCNPTTSVIFYIGFNFGDSVHDSSAGDPTLQLLSVTNSTTAAAEVPSVRMIRLSADQSAATAASINPGAALIATALNNSSAPPDGADSHVKRYLPIVIGLLGANLLVVLVLAVIELVLCVKRSGKRGSRSWKFAPVRFKEETRPLDSCDDKRYSDLGVCRT